MFRSPYRFSLSPLRDLCIVKGPKYIQFFASRFGVVKSRPNEECSGFYTWTGGTIYLHAVLSESNARADFLGMNCWAAIGRSSNDFLTIEGAGSNSSPTPRPARTTYRPQSMMTTLDLRNDIRRMLCCKRQINAALDANSPPNVPPRPLLPPRLPRQLPPS